MPTSAISAPPMAGPAIEPIEKVSPRTAFAGCRLLGAHRRGHEPGDRGLEERVGGAEHGGEHDEQRHAGRGR